MQDILCRFFRSEDVQTLLEKRFTICRAVLERKKKVLYIYTESNDDFTDADQAFVEHHLTMRYNGYRVQVLNQVLPLALTETDTIDTSMTDDDARSLFETIIQEDAIYVEEQEKTVAEAQNRMKLSDKKSYVYTPKKKDLTDPIKISQLDETTPFPTVEGEIFDVDCRDTKTGNYKIVKFCLYDGSDSLYAKLFASTNKIDDVLKDIRNGVFIRCNGEYSYDTYDRSMSMRLRDYQVVEKPVKMDDAPEKRVEIHAHTKMSLLSGSIEPKELVQTLKKWGHRGFALTDLSCVQAYPDVMALSDASFKIVYGMEGIVFDDHAYMITGVNDERDITVDRFIVLDIETTGLDPYQCEIIEIGAVKIEHCEIVDTFETFIHPSRPIPPFITELTGINDEMVSNAPRFADIAQSFLDWIGEAVLVAHNAEFDIGFLRYHFESLGLSLHHPVLDTLQLSRHTLPDLKKHKLDVITDRLGICLEHHHRASDDAKATALALLKMREILVARKEIAALSDLVHMEDEQNNRTWNTLIYVQNQIGLKNLYHLVSNSHIETFKGVPRIRKSDLQKYREGLLLVSEGLKGEVIKLAQSGFSDRDITECIKQYDGIEIQPLDHYLGWLHRKKTDGLQTIIPVLRRVIDLAEKAGVPVYAGGNVYEMTAEDHILRNILATARKDFFAEREAPLFLKTTSEMLDGYGYLSPEKAKEIVLQNPQALLDACDTIRPIPAEKYPPIVEGSDEDLKTSCYEKARSIYGDPLPNIVSERLEKELGSIIRNGYSVMYMIAKKLVEKSEEDGYLVGSRGSVGSSFAATMSGITEVNPLPAHYVCPNCKHSEFYENGDFDAGVDMPDKVCPICQTMMRKDGYTIPFETFLGFTGEKEPDIDLNFAGEYQSKAHQYTEELFGSGYVFRAGTIGTIQQKIAYGYVRAYFEDHGREISRAEIQRLTAKMVGMKRTTGQHPGGIMIVPKNKNIHDFSPIQYPADLPSSGVFTTHFAYKAIHSNILKLDILGHDGPTMMRMLQDYTGVNIADISFSDPGVLEMFRSTDPIGVKSEDIDSTVSTLGIPEFGTNFVRKMLSQTLPRNFSDLIRISGLSHGTDVWTNNAQELVESKICALKDVIATREDIMTYLLKAGLPNDFSFFTMEKVRKGKPLSEEDMEKMRAHNLPQWYIDSCNKIKYMFPKAHAVAYVMLSFRVAWFKLYYPVAFYATYFSVKTSDFDYDTVSRGLTAVEESMRQFRNNEAASEKEKATFRVNEVAKEMLLRGINCLEVDLYASDAKKFLIRDGAILPPLSVIPNLGEQVALLIVEERQKSPFLSEEDFMRRTHVNKTCLQYLSDRNLLGNMQKTNQISLF